MQLKQKALHQGHGPQEHRHLAQRVADKSLNNVDTLCSTLPSDLHPGQVYGQWAKEGSLTYDGIKSGQKETLSKSTGCSSRHP